MAAQVLSTEHHYGAVWTREDDAQEFEFEVITYADGSVEVAWAGRVVAEGKAGDDFDFGTLAREVYDMDPTDLSDYYTDFDDD